MYAIYGVGYYTSGSPSSSGAVNTKTLAFVYNINFIEPVIMWFLASNVGSCLVPIA